MVLATTVTPAGMVNTAGSPPAFEPSPPTSAPISTFPRSLQITSLVRVRSSLTTPDIAHTVLPAIAESVDTFVPEGQLPVKTEPPTATVVVVAVGAAICESSPGDEIPVSEPPPQEAKNINEKVINPRCLLVSM